MRCFLALIFFCLSWCNYAFSQKINIENKILLNVPDNFIFIEGDSKSEFIEPIITFLGNDVKAYLIGTKNSVNFTKLYQENPDEMFEEIMIKMEKKNFKSMSSAENFLAKKGGFKEVLNVKNRKYCGDHLYKQKDYFYINGNRIKYDLEIDFDYLEKGFKTLTDRLNLDPNFFSTKHNVGNYKQQHYSLFYTKKIIKIVKDLYQEDLNFFDFDYKQPKKISKLLKLKMLLNKI